MAAFQGDMYGQAPTPPTKKKVPVYTLGPSAPDINNQASYGYEPAPYYGFDDPANMYTPAPAASSPGYNVLPSWQQPAAEAAAPSNFFSNLTPYGGTEPAETPGAPQASPAQSLRVGSGSSGAYGGGSTNYGSTTTTTRTLPGIPRPEFVAPERDEARISELTQKGMGPGVRESRRALNRALLTAGREENPAARKYVAGEAMRGFGDTMSKVAGQSRQVAQQQYEQEYGTGFNEALTNFSSAMQDYMARFGTTTTTKPTTASGGVVASNQWGVNAPWLSGGDPMSDIR